MPMNLGLGLGLSRRGGSTVPVLDILTAGAAYSTRKLRTAYAGAALRVRRSSDNTEQDIGFVGTALDTAALATFVGANSGFVVTWYDQSGNGRNVTQATQANQPRIVNAGVIETLGGVPAPRWTTNTTSLRNTTPFMYAAGAATVLAVSNIASATAGIVVGENNTGVVAPQYLVNLGGTGDMRTFIRNDANTLLLDNVLFASAFNGTGRQFVFRDTGSAADGFINGAIGTTRSYTRSSAATLNQFSISLQGAGGLGPIGHIAEIIIFTSALSSADQNLVSLNQGAAYGISVAPYFTAVERLGQINGAPDNGPSLAVGLNGIADWTEPVFIDRAKQGYWARPSFTPTPAANLDSELALASLPSGDTTQFFFLSSYSNTVGKVGPTPPDRSGRFRMTFTGSATGLIFQGCTNVTQIDANTYEFDCDWNGNKWIVMTPTAFPIKVSVIRTDLLTDHAGGAIFDPDWLANVPTGGCLRFMDWTITNLRGTGAAAVTALSEYPVESWQSWRRVPLSAIVSLCNAKSVDPWINIGHRFPDAMVTAWAEYLRDNLNSARKIRVELSNEIWNLGTFDQGDFFASEAQTVWGVPDGYTSNIFLSYAGKRFAQVMQIFNTVFAGQTGRLIGVIGGQAANTATATAMINAPQWQASEPGSYVRPGSLARELSIAPYLFPTSAVAQGNEIKVQLDISEAAAISYVLNTLTPLSITQSRGWIDSYVPIASNAGLRLTMYEFNNHFDLNIFRSSDLWTGVEPNRNPVAGALDMIIKATYDQAMADAQDDIRTYFKAQNGSLQCFFVDVSYATRDGTWGAKSHLEHDSPIWNTAITWWNNNPRNWTQ